MTRNYGKQPRIWGSGSSAPWVLWKRDAGGLAPRWQGTELQANKEAGADEPWTAARGWVAILRSAGGVCHYSAPTREPPRRAKGKNSGCRKRKRQAPLPLTPAPSQPHNWEQQKLRGHRGNMPRESGYTVSSELRPFTFQARMSCFLRLVAVVTGKMTAAVPRAASLIRTQGNNFPPRAPWPRKLLYHFRVVVTDALQPSSGGLARLLLEQRRRWDTGK